jgi:LPS-assembly lipoprotein
MSWSDRSVRLARLTVAGLLSLALTGCFRPMYASTAPGTPRLSDVMASVAIEPVKGRVAQQVRNNLDFGLTGGSGSAPPRYTLNLDVNSTVSTSIVDARTNEPQVDTVMLLADFTLTPVGGPQPAVPVLVGKNYARKSYDRTLQRFAALRAARDAENSAAKVLADEIKTRVAIYLSEHP